MAKRRRLIILISMLVRRPFTLQYAREQVPCPCRVPLSKRTTPHGGMGFGNGHSCGCRPDYAFSSKAASSVGDRGHAGRPQRRTLVYEVVPGPIEKAEERSIMIHYKFSCLRAASLAALFAASLSSSAQNAVDKVLVGNTKVTMIHSYSGKDKLSKPALVTVFNFDLPIDAVTIDRSMEAHILNHDPIAHMKGDAGQASDPAAVAAKVQAAFSKRLINELKKTKIPVTSADSSAASNPPAYVLTVRGAFTAVRQGNMGARMMIGFGRGASDVKAHVVVSLIAPGSPILLAEFDLESVSGKKPGAAATMGVGSAAASVGTSTATDSKASVEGDTTRMAKTVATEIEDLMVAQQWIPPMKKSKQSETAEASQ